MTTSVLTMPNSELICEVYTDASDYGIEAVLVSRKTFVSLS